MLCVWLELLSRVRLVAVCETHDEALLAANYSREGDEELRRLLVDMAS